MKTTTDCCLGVNIFQAQDGNVNNLLSDKKAVSTLCGEMGPYPIRNTGVKKERIGIGGVRKVGVKKKKRNNTTPRKESETLSQKK